MLKLIFNFILFFLISFSNLALAVDFYEREILNSNPSRWRYIKSPVQPVELQPNQNLTGTIKQYYVKETTTVTSALTGLTKSYTRYKRAPSIMYVPVQDNVNIINNPEQEYVNPTDSNSHTHVSGNNLWPTVNLALTPSGDDIGVGTLELVPGVHDGVHNEITGAFRTECRITHYGNDDPIVYPNEQGKAHHHTFFGNINTNYQSTPLSIRTTGSSSCDGGIANRSAYWIPSVIDTINGAPLKPFRGIIYYKQGLAIAEHVMPFPPGLVMIAGNAGAVTPAESNGNFTCWNENTGSVSATSKTIPVCSKSTNSSPLGGFVRVKVEFPNCWDGVNLDSANHKSHMAYPSEWQVEFIGTPQERWYKTFNNCPLTHPVAVPQISEIFDYQVTDATNGTNNWRLSSDNYSTAQRGGLSLHADWMYGWNDSIMQRIVTNCLNALVDCGVNFLGDNQSLKNNP